VKQSHPTEPFSTHTQINPDPIFRKKKLIPWIGGKHLLAPKIIELIPEHDCYCEVFAGGASVFWLKNPSKIEILNDINQELINLLRIVQYHPEEFIRNFQFLVKSRAEFYRQLKLPPEALTDIQRAVRTLYIIKNCFSGRFKNPSFSAAVDGRKCFSPRFIQELIIACHTRLENVLLECLPYQECIKKYDKPDTFFYLDPPYFGCEEYYGNEWKREDFYILARLLKECKGKFLLSINDTPEVREIFKDFECIKVKTRYSSGAGSGKTKSVIELIFKNY
jgi:DNA adenine methylase